MVKYQGILTALGPIAHGADEKLGTDTKLRRIKMMHNNEPIDVPIISGNAYRGVLRRIAANDFLQHIGYKENMLSDKLYYMMFTGGALKKGSAADHIMVGEKRELRAMIPFLSVFGTACDNQIMEGKLKCMICLPVCSETQQYTDIESNLSMWDIVDEIYYTRRDDREDRAGDKAGAQQMKYNIEIFATGTKFYHEFVLDSENIIERSCFGALMAEFQKVPVLGGNGAIGHGKIKLEYSPEFEDGEIYYNYLEENKEKINTYIQRIL
ncbi:MAG: hypothetical protein ACFFG0_05475 [Candidatus Thorarchaeota archaeon]